MGRQQVFFAPVIAFQAPPREKSASTLKVRIAAAELGYSRDLRASGLRRRTAKSVGVVIADLDNPYNVGVIRGITQVLEADDFVPLMAETGESRERFERLLEHLVGRRVDAVITSTVARCWSGCSAAKCRSATYILYLMGECWQGDAGLDERVTAALARLEDRIGKRLGTRRIACRSPGRRGPGRDPAPPPLRLPKVETEGGEG